MIGSTLAMALRALTRNRLRSALTMLGVVIGVAAVIALVTIGRSATEHITGQVQQLGDNLLWAEPGGSNRSSSLPAPPLELADAEAIGREIASIRVASPSATRFTKVRHESASYATRVWGVTDSYFEVRNYEVGTGRPFTPADYEAGASVCLLGQTVKRELYGTAPALGSHVRVGQVSCRVVGLLASKGSSSITDDQDDMVLMPLRAYHRRLAGNRNVDIIFASARPGRSTSLVAHQMSALLRERRRITAGETDDFRVRSLEEFNTKVRSITGVLTALLGAIAGVSLLVGGIGIMNIMLVSVTERTREIGIRLAIGAQAREVLQQFLVEAIVLASLGGIIGMGIGLLGSYAATRALSLPLVLSPHIVAIAFFFSALVGIVFGYLPARRAARLHPIEALRHE